MQNTSHAVMAQRHEAAERWLPIESWPGYEVSDLGRVRSWKQRSPGRVWLPRYDMPPRILKHDMRNGYPSVVLCDKDAGRKWESIHRLVLTAFVGAAPAGAQGAHGNGDTTDNRLANLRWAAPSENNADKKLHGTHQFGERIGSSKLNRKAIKEIIRRRARGEKVASVAAAFGVCRNTITNITTGRSWVTGGDVGTK
jgi:hypothetical protein